MKISLGLKNNFLLLVAFWVAQWSGALKSLDASSATASTKLPEVWASSSSTRGQRAEALGWEAGPALVLALSLDGCVTWAGCLPSLSLSFTTDVKVMCQGTSEVHHGVVFTSFTLFSWLFYLPHRGLGTTGLAFGFRCVYCPWARPEPTE